LCCDNAVGPNIPVSIDKAVFERTAHGALNMIPYAFMVTHEKAMNMFMVAGADGIIVGDSAIPYVAGLVRDHVGNTRTATRDDDPFSITDPSRAGYGLEVQTT